MPDLKQAIRDVPDFPRAGILFRDIAPLLRDHFEATVDALDGLLSAQEWREVDALAGIESRGFILGAALAHRRQKGFVLVIGHIHHGWGQLALLAGPHQALA